MVVLGSLLFGLLIGGLDNYNVKSTQGSEGETARVDGERQGRGWKFGKSLTEIMSLQKSTLATKSVYLLERTHT